MTLRISGKSISVGEALRGRVSVRTEEEQRKKKDSKKTGRQSCRDLLKRSALSGKAEAPLRRGR